MNQQHLFQLTSSHQSFNDKQKNIFDELNKVNVTLPQYKGYNPEESKSDAHIKSCKLSLKCLRGKESIFKRPEVPARKCLPTRRMPDFKKNPHKWTKYTLNDVKEEDLSENGNRKAALTFLKELECRNTTKNDMDTCPTNLDNKITFHKSALITNIESNEAKQTFKNTKVLMPEYVVGQKMKKERKSKNKTFGQTTKQLLLAHLTEEDEEN